VSFTKLASLSNSDLDSRDIKPDNLLLDENGYCHLTDFNISVQYTDAKPTASNFAGILD
jgi:serine/threonine protein kinase